MSQRNFQNLSSMALRCNVLWRVNVSGDRMSTKSSAEAHRFDTEATTFYIPAEPGTDRMPLYRMFNGRDHMDSINVNESPHYQCELTLGYPWREHAGPRGTNVGHLKRLYNEATYDHALVSRVNEPLRGYRADFDMPVLGYPRLGGAKLLPISNGEIEIKSNEMAGGQVWEWHWNGRQFLETADFGRGIQSSLSIPMPSLADPAVSDPSLPTEGGGFSRQSVEPLHLQGSPVVNLHNEGFRQVSRAVPLEWQNHLFGCETDQIIAYPEFVIGKNLIFNDERTVHLSTEHRKRIVTYETVFYSPFEMDDVAIEIPTAYLKPDFNSFWRYDAENATLTRMPSHSEYRGAGGVILATQEPHDYAMGVYGSPPSMGGSVTYFNLLDFTNHGLPTVKWRAAYSLADGEPGTFGSGEPSSALRL